MRRCYNADEVKEANAKGTMEAVEQGYIDTDSAGAFIVGFNKECDKFCSKYNVHMMMMFTEAHEMEDEEFGLALIDDEWKMIYISARGDDVRLLVFE